MTAESEPRHPMAEAMQLVSLVTTAALEMTLFGVAGHWCDRWLGTRFLGLVALAVGVPLGIVHLLWMLRRHAQSKGPGHGDH